jgi:two-component sensor histidine kinase
MPGEVMVEQDAEGVPSGRARWLGISLSNAGVAVVAISPDRRVEWMVNGCGLLGEAIVPGATITGALPKALLDMVETHILRHQAQAAGAGGNAAWPRELTIDQAGNAHWIDVWIDTVSDDAGVASHLVTIIDTTERQRREQTLRTLLREVAHRSKNMLAIVQAIATQTGRYASTTEQFLTRFRGRILSLASTQDIVTSSDWRGADLGELIKTQVGRYVSDAQASLRITGVSPYLNPNAALHVGLALHELAINSLTYGAMGRVGETVSIDGRRDPGTGDLVLTWTEALEALDRSAVARKFGSITLERVVPAALNGSANLEIGSHQLVYSLSIPSGSLDAD